MNESSIVSTSYTLQTTHINMGYLHTCRCLRVCEFEILGKPSSDAKYNQNGNNNSSSQKSMKNTHSNMCEAHTSMSIIRSPFELFYVIIEHFFFPISEPTS